MRTAFQLGLTLTLIVTAGSVPAQEEKQAAIGKLVGTYKIVSGKKGDRAIPKDHLVGSVRIAQDTITLHDEDNKEVYVIRYSIDQLGEPYRVAMTVTRATRKEAQDSKARALIKTDGDRVTLIYDTKAQDYPNGFEPKGDSQHLFVLERMGKK